MLPEHEHNFNIKWMDRAIAHPIGHTVNSTINNLTIALLGQKTFLNSEVSSLVKTCSGLKLGPC